MLPYSHCCCDIYERSHVLISHGQPTREFPRTLLIVTLLTLLLAATPGALCAQKSKDAPAPKPWPKPKKLIEQIDQLAEFSSATKTWSETTKQLILVVADASQNSQQRQVTLDQLSKQLDKLTPLNQKVWQTRQTRPEATTISSDIVRMHYRLSRRIEMWQSLLSMPAGVTVADYKSPFQQTGFRRLNFSGLDASWSEYLMVDEYQQAFESANSTTDFKKDVARRILARVYSPSLGQRQSSYALSVYESQLVKLKSFASNRVDPRDLLSRIEYYESDTSARAGHVLNQRYQDLLWSDVAEDRATASVIDTHYRNANFRLTISGEFMNRLLPQLPMMAEPVSETVKGALVSGQSQVTNQIDVDLIPDPNRLNFEIKTQGQVMSDTMARTKSVRIFNQGFAWFVVTKPITVDRNGIDISQNAYSVGRAQQKLVDIQSNVDNIPLVGSFIRRIAENKVREETTETNQLFRRKVVTQAEARVEETLAKQVVKVETDAQKYLQQPLIALELDPEPVQLATTEKQIIMRYRLAGRDQMAANTSRPQDLPDSLVSVQVHQSLLNNAIARIGLNGNTFNSEELAEHLQKVLALDPKTVEADADQRGRDASFKFADHDPIRIAFVENHVNITLSFAKFSVSDRGKSLKNVSMTASYELATNGMQVRLIQNDNRTRFTRTRGKSLSVGDRLALSTVMKVMFKKQYDFEGLPKQFKNHQQSQDLEIAQLVLSDGWIGVSLQDRQVETAESTRMIDRIPQRITSLRKAIERR